MPYLGNIPATQFAELKYQDFTGGTGTSFTLNDPVGSAQELEVFVNNVRQEPGVAYTVSGTGLTMVALPRLMTFTLCFRVSPRVRLRIRRVRR
jgi:hypothetical protein